MAFFRSFTRRSSECWTACRCAWHRLFFAADMHSWKPRQQSLPTLPKRVRSSTIFNMTCDHVEASGLSCRYGDSFFFRTGGSPKCAFCTPLCTFSVWLTDKKTSKWQDSTLCILPLGHAKLQTNDKTQLSASFPWGMQSCKQKPNKNQKQKTKKTTLCLRHSGPVGLLGFLGFCCFFCFFFFLFFFVFFGFADLWPTLSSFGS